MRAKLIRQGARVWVLAIAAIPLVNPSSGRASSLQPIAKPSQSEKAPVYPLTPELLSQASEIAPITRIQVIPTEQGAELILTTAQGEALESTLTTEGNLLVVDIANAQLEAGTFVETDPIAGIANVEAIAPTANQVQIRITGVDAAPTGQIVSNQSGLTLSIFPTPAAAAPEPIRIVVTAEKQPDTLQDVPISITAFTEEEIEDADITSIEQIAGLTPNFSVYTLAATSCCTAFVA